MLQAKSDKSVVVHCIIDPGALFLVHTRLMNFSEK